MAQMREAHECSEIELIAKLLWRIADLIGIRRLPPSDAVCGRCGYSTRGLPTLTCPECGNELNVVGIRVPVRVVLLPRVRIGLWSAVVAVAAWLTVPPLTSLLAPRVVLFHESVILDQPISGAYINVHIAASGRAVRWSWQPPLNRVTPASGVLILRPLAGPQQRLKLSVVTRASILELMANAGIDAADDQVRAEADELMEMARRAGLGSMTAVPTPSFRLSPYGRPQLNRSSPWAAVVTTGLWGLWIVLWLAGASYLRRSYRKSKTAGEQKVSG